MTIDYFGLPMPDMDFATAGRFRNAQYNAAQELAAQRKYIPGFDRFTEQDLALIRMEAARRTGIWPPKDQGAQT